MATPYIQGDSSLVPDHVNITDITPFLDGGTDQDDYRIRYRREILTILLDSAEALPTSLNPSQGIWMAEANHRSLAMLQLLLLLNRPIHEYHGRERFYVQEYENAKRLARVYRLLDACCESNLVPCEAVIHGIINGLVKVFNVTNGVVDLKFYSKSLNLKANKRRALALLISKLVVDMLKDGAKRLIAGRLILSFLRVDRRQMFIRIETSCPILESLSSPGYDIVCALSGVLASEILCGKGTTGGTYVELLIPLESQHDLINRPKDYGRYFRDTLPKTYGKKIRLEVRD
jgi:hypothetical protein